MLLVTGSSGQIGSYVVDLARTRGLAVEGLDLRPSRWTTHVGDICDASACARALAGKRQVIHCAAQVSVPRSIEDPVGDARNNVLGSLQLLQAASQAGVQRFINTSSAAVYGDPVSLPLGEDSPTVPLSPYGAAKLAGEAYARVFRALHGLEAVSVRPFNVFSPRQDPASPYSGVLTKFVERIRQGRPPLVLGDGTQTRDFVHARDVAGWMIDLATQPAPPPHTVNLGSGRATTILDLARMVLALAGVADEPDLGPPRAGDIQHSVAEVAVARSLGLAAPQPLQTGLEELLARLSVADKP